MYSRVLISSLTIAFGNSVPKKLFRGQIWPQTSKYFVLNETQYKMMFKGADFEFDNRFCKFAPKKYLLAQICPRNFKLLYLKLNVAPSGIQGG